MRACTYPPPVERGDTVAVLAPSHSPPEAALRQGIDRLESFGVETKVYETATRDTDWLKDHPRERAADLRRAFEDDDVTGVVAAMGGNVAHELLDYFDPEVARANPKRFFGSSDNTHVHLMLNDAGVVSFYGGNVFPDFAADPEMHPFTREYLERALRATPFGEVAPAQEWTDEYYDVESDATREWFPPHDWTWHNADPERDPVRAPVVGGCMEMLRTQLMLDSPYFAAETVDGCVLALETSGETPVVGEVERFVSALGERGFLDLIDGLLVGKPETPGESLDARQHYREQQRRAILETVDKYRDDLLTVFDLDFGHAAPVLPIPLGAPVEIDPGEQTIAFPAVDDGDGDAADDRFSPDASAGT